MKRIIVSFIVILAFCHVSAQTLDSIAHHVVGYYGPNGGGQMDNVAQMSDGNVLFIRKEGINMNSTLDVVGNVHYKLSRYGCILLDTLFVPDSDPSYYLFAKNPNGDDNIRVGIVHDSTSGGSFFQIFPFDSDLNYDTLNEVFVPLSDTFAYSIQDGYLINKHNDLVLTYVTPLDGDDYDLHFACFGLDGTLKHENVLPLSAVPLYGEYKFGIFNDSPLEYCWYGHNYSNKGVPYFACYLFDSLFQYQNSFSIAALNSHFYFKYFFVWGNFLLDDGNDFIYGSKFEQGYAKNGVCLVRYDKQTFEPKNVVFFDSRPMLPNASSGFGAFPIGLAKDAEGYFYFSYNTQNLMVTDKVQVAVVKLDADFNILWHRYCLEPEGYRCRGSVMTVLDDGGVAVGGGYWGRPEVFFLILSDDGCTVSETEAPIRPYTYWPNPAQDHLHLQFSPDVTPKQIELYDLQGRLVRMQKNGLERLEMNGLPSGTYTMRVTMKDGKVFVDKVVKD